MLLIDTYLNITTDSGIGLFSKCKIKEGDIFWVRNESFDRIITAQEIDHLPVITKNFMTIYGFQEINYNWYICIDNARFSNHSKFPNTIVTFNNEGLVESHIAAKNIEIGEEILCDYTKFCMTCKNGLPFIDVLK